MPKHTPSPWRVRHPNQFEVADAAGELIARVEPLTNAHALAELEADMRLIAAAPQMFDLLMELQAVATDLGHEDDGDLSGRDADEMRDIGWRASNLLQGRQLLPEGEH